MKGGDVLLVKGITFLAKVNVFSQKVFYFNASSSHVALLLGDGVLIHATNKGVELGFLPDELISCEPSWRVIRLKDIEEPKLELVVKSGLHFARQAYNIGFLLNGTDDTSFCSELVAKAYGKAGVEVFSNKAPSKIIPCDFDREADLLNQWEDVTQEYKDLLITIAEDEPSYRMNFNILKQSVQRRNGISAIRELLFEQIINIADTESNHGLLNAVNTVKDELLAKRELSFWDEHDATHIDKVISKKGKVDE